MSRYAHDAGSEPLILTENGTPIAAMIPIEDADLDSVALGTNKRFLEILETARAQRRAGEGMDSQEVRRVLGLQ